jgi:catechol 2,3-dioxygenase-like lactoylglutathione lyase family enzyme
MSIIVDHVHLIVTDIPGTVAWFKENFGARERYLGIENDSFDGTCQYYLDFGNTGVFVRGMQDNEALAPDPGNRFGINHISLRVPDVFEKLAELRAKGVKVLQEPDVMDENQAYAFVQGPDNIRIELIHRKHLK